MVTYHKVFFCKNALYGRAAGGIMIPMGKCKKNAHQTPYRCESNGKHCRFFEPGPNSVEIDSAETASLELEQAMAEAEWMMRHT